MRRARPVPMLNDASAEGSAKTARKGARQAARQAASEARVAGTKANARTTLPGYSPGGPRVDHRHLRTPARRVPPGVRGAVPVTQRGFSTGHAGAALGLYGAGMVAGVLVANSITCRSRGTRWAQRAGGGGSVSLSDRADRGDHTRQHREVVQVEHGGAATRRWTPLSRRWSGEVWMSDRLETADPFARATGDRLLSQQTRAGDGQRLHFVIVTGLGNSELTHIRLDADATSVAGSPTAQRGGRSLN